MPDLLKVGVFLCVCKNTNVDMKWGLKHQPNSLETARQFSLFDTKKHTMVSGCNVPRGEDAKRIQQQDIIM